MQVPGTRLQPQDPYAVGIEPVSGVLGSSAIHGVEAYQGYGSLVGQNSLLNATYSNYGTQQVPFSDMNSSHTSYHTTTTAADVTSTATATATATITTNPHQSPYPPHQGHYPESSYQYGH